MVAASPKPTGTERVRALSIPVINLSWRRDRVLELMLRACEEFGFFRVINHGVPGRIIAKMEAQAAEFFSLPSVEKQRSGPANPLGYGNRNIGFNGDTGDLEYLLLPTNPTSISQRARTINRKDPIKFSSVMNEYVESVRELACEILEMLGEGLGLEDRRAFSRLITDRESDSLVRLNHYPPCYSLGNNGGSEDGKNDCKGKDGRGGRIGFGEHSDPQVLSILRSNDVDGLQILMSSPEGGGVWVPVPADPAAFFISVGDLLQALTNGRFVSVRHKVMANSYRSRLSMIYFGGPALQTRISPHLEMITTEAPRLYKSFTWADYKKSMYSLRLGYNRLDLYRIHGEEESIDPGKQF